MAPAGIWVLPEVQTCSLLPEGLPVFTEPPGWGSLLQSVKADRAQMLHCPRTVQNPAFVGESGGLVSIAPEGFQQIWDYSAFSVQSPIPALATISAS